MKWPKHCFVKHHSWPIIPILYTQSRIHKRTHTAIQSVHCIQSILPKRTSYRQMFTAKSTPSYLSGELHLMEKTTYKYMELPWASTENGSCFCKYFHGEGRNKDVKSKRFKTARLETIHWWHLLPLGRNQRRDNRTETKFLDTTEYKGERFKTESVLHVDTH